MGMNNLNLDLSPSYAKIARAREHFETLKREIERAAKRHPYALKVSKIDPNGWCTITCVPRQVTEFRLGIIVGDLVHNLRSALDYIVVALVEKSGETVVKSNQFPIFDNGIDFANNAGLGFPGKGNLAGVKYGLGEICRMQPFNGTPNVEDHFLFLINRFSNADKHRVVSATLFIPQDVDVEFAQGTVVERQRIATRANWTPDIEYEFERVRFAHPFPSDFSVNSNITVSVHFSTPGFGKHPIGQIVGALMFEALCDAVVEVVDNFKAL